MEGKLDKAHLWKNGEESKRTPADIQVRIWVDEGG